MPDIVIVGDNLTSSSSYTPRTAYLFQQVLKEVGLRTIDVAFARPNEVSHAIRTHRPNVIVACGDRAAAATIAKWDATASSERMRGYFFEGAFGPTGPKVLLTIDPAKLEREWTPWRVLLSYDLQRAREHSKSPAIVRPTRDVHVVSSLADAKRCADDLTRASRLAFDIEISDNRTTACVGFASSPSRAVVFPARYLPYAQRVLTSDVPKIAQNGQFDCHFLLTRNNIRVRALRDDTLLAWHSCYPELAGTKLDAQGKRKGIRRTHKSLAFFASLFTLDAWWKDYEFANEYEMYVLNGRDCCITFDVMQHLDSRIARLDVRATYDLEMSLVWPCVEMLARGLHVDNELRQERVAALSQRIESADDRINELLLPFLRERIGELPERVAALFRNREVCKCCRNGAGKRLACWSCAGFDKAPSKKALGDKTLGECTKCQGRGVKEWLWFNSRSVDQKRAILYDVLRLPKKFEDGKLSTDEEALKNLLAHVST